MKKINIKNPLTIFTTSLKVEGVNLIVEAEDVEIIEEEESSIPTDLTGYTISVPSGWSATSGYGIFSLNGSINIIDTSYTYPYNLYGSGNSSNFYIGYNSYNSANRSPDAKADSISYRDSDGVYSAMYSYSTYSFSLVITGGSSVSNSTLIQWFVDNGATFTKTN